MHSHFKQKQPIDYIKSNLSSNIDWRIKLVTYLVLSKLGSSITSALKKLVGAGRVDAALVRELKNDLLKALLEADVKLEIALEVTERVEKRAL